MGPVHTWTYGTLGHQVVATKIGGFSILALYLENSEHLANIPPVHPYHPK